MTWSPSAEINIGGFNKVADVHEVEVVKPLLVVGVGNGNDSALHSSAESNSVGVGIWSKHLDASLLVVFA